MVDGSAESSDGDAYWSTVDEFKPYAQGDILRGLPADAGGEPTFGLIITADCDIVQGKASDRLTYVEVVTSRAYLERIWIPDQLQRFVKKQARVAAEGLGAIMRRSDLKFTLTEEQLLSWLTTRQVDAIAKAVNRTGKPLDAKLVKNLNALRCAIGADVYADHLSQWRALREILGDDPERQQSEIATALSGGGGFPDFFLLPDLPAASGVGYMALLRFIRTVDADEIFSSEVDARIHDRPTALHRVGQLNDRIRFAVTQKLAFLFSRIGLPAHFEDASRSAAALAAESIFTGA